MQSGLQEECWRSAERWCILISATIGLEQMGQRVLQECWLLEQEEVVRASPGGQSPDFGGQSPDFGTVIGGGGQSPDIGNMID